MLPIFFIALLAVESVCFYYHLMNRNNLIIYNFWFPVEFAVYTFWVTAYLNNRTIKRCVTFCIPGYVVLVIFLYIAAADLHLFNTLAFQLGVVLLVPVLLLKMYEFINEPIVIYPFRNAMFWLVTGLLVTNLGSFFQFSLENYLVANHKALLHMLKTLNVMLNYVLYSCIIVYFILSWQTRRLHT